MFLKHFSRRHMRKKKKKKKKEGITLLLFYMFVWVSRGLCSEYQYGRVEVIQQWPPSGILPRAHPVGAGALEPAVRPHQTMAFCCKQSKGSLPGALSNSPSLFPHTLGRIQSVYRNSAVVDRQTNVRHKSLYSICIWTCRKPRLWQRNKHNQMFRMWSEAR